MRTRSILKPRISSLLLLYEQLLYMNKQKTRFPVFQRNFRVKDLQNEEEISVVSLRSHQEQYLLSDKRSKEEEPPSVPIKEVSASFLLLLCHSLYLLDQSFYCASA